MSKSTIELTIGDYLLEYADEDKIVKDLIDVLAKHKTSINAGLIILEDTKQIILRQTLINSKNIKVNTNE